ncbi:sulfatase-like hydrolase/transferase [Rufibacter tibetensis]|uniref:Metalloenzyme domain-containing protein n=1 Tax=Rufibacter tibetensis TaxID=512763 RepID=A0A0P0CMQ1_9BACT|nr:sulfatase-like hydrolase/transferase [Rufibacter tibetensis]ALI98278.1 hypothetical protein DC20_03880 [Rufibacter tibetensis]
MKKAWYSSLIILVLFSFFMSCTLQDGLHTKGVDESPISYKTENVIIVVIDGPRFSETLGDSTGTYSPFLTKDFLKDGGLALTNFYNDGFTYTNSGHAAILTGFRQEIRNDGTELPQRPSIFQAWLKHTGKQNKSAWLVTSKGKLDILANTQDSTWHNKYLPSTSCGIDSGKRNRGDLLTFDEALSILKTDRPNLMLINLKDPDVAGHQKKWGNYLKGIQQSDSLVSVLWSFLKNDQNYNGKTTLLVTNDHGRHTDGISDGFINHGDGCEGCRHITLFAAGPDFKKNIKINTLYRQRDIAATVAELLNFKLATEGTVMQDLFK